MKYSFGFGKGQVSVNIPENKVMAQLLPYPVSAPADQAAEIKNAMTNPLGSPRLMEIVKPGEKVVIITSDITRPMPSKLVLPIVLEELRTAGINDKDMTIVFGLGSHRLQTETEKRYLVGAEIFDRICCLDSDSADCLHLGQTSRGTPVDIFRPVVEADRRVCLGNIEYHYFAGYSGGAKAIMPGVSTRDAIQANHSHMVRENACAGKITGNPVREDIEEVTGFIPIDFILNVVLDEQKKVVKAVAGHHLMAHRAGCEYLDGLYQVTIKHRADLVVVSAGGYPKDINLYQAQKSLDNAKYAVRDGGIIILAASCKEGLGEHVFEEWMLAARQPADLIKRIQQQFQLGGHKAAAIALIQAKARVYLVSDLEAEFVRRLFMVPFNSLQEAVDAALSELGQAAEVLLMPVGGSTLPFIAAEKFPKRLDHAIIV